MCPTSHEWFIDWFFLLVVNFLLLILWLFVISFVLKLDNVASANVAMTIKKKFLNHFSLSSKHHLNDSYWKYCFSLLKQPRTERKQKKILFDYITNSPRNTLNFDLKKQDCSIVNCLPFVYDLIFLFMVFRWFSCFIFIFFINFIFLVRQDDQ